MGQRALNLEILSILMGFMTLVSVVLCLLGKERGLLSVLIVL